MKAFKVPNVRGVSLGQHVKGGTFYVRFRVKGKQFAVSTETESFDLAGRIAGDLLALLKNPADKNERLARAVEIFKTYASGANVFDELERKIDNARKNVKADPGEDESSAEQQKRAAHNKDFVTLLKEREEMQLAYKTAAEDARLKISTLEARVRELEGLIKATGSRILAKQSHLRLEDAKKNFLKSGHSSKSKYVKTYDSILTRFVEHLGNDKNVWDVIPDEAIGYLEDSCDEWGHSYLRQSYLAINFFMRRSTQGNWIEYPLKEWHKNNSKPEEKEWFWLEDDESDDLIEKMKEQFGQYWADAAIIQRACGFRPEELGFLQTKNVELKGQVSIFVDRLVDDKGSVIRTLKTLRSRDRVNVPSWAVDAVKRRVKAGGLILFPRDESADAPARWNVYTEFESKNKLWPSSNASEGQTFSTHLRIRLRAAALQIESLAQKSEKIVARTFRATCGKELLLSDKTVEQVGAVLRDNPDTIRRHYARLLASDVSTERRVNENKSSKKQKENSRR